MKTTPLVLLASLAIAACSSTEQASPRGGDRSLPPGGPSDGSSPPQARPGGFGAGGGFNRAAALVDAGRFAEALPLLRCSAARGEGYEVSQHLAGISALEVSVSEALSEDRRADYRREGFERLTLAAEAGWPASQAELAERYAEIDTDEARYLAAYWDAVYHANRRDQALGIDRIPTPVSNRIRAAAGEDALARAQTDAGGFVATTLVEVETGPECERAQPAAQPGPSVRRTRVERRHRGGGRPGQLNADQRAD